MITPYPHLGTAAPADAFRGTAGSGPLQCAAMKLTEKQRRHLRGLGHALKPIISIGQAGASDPVVAETVRALNDHELVKVRVTGMERDARDEALDSLATRTKSEMVGRIGHTAVLYKKHPEKPRIVLPGSIGEPLAPQTPDVSRQPQRRRRPG
jgi:RNA-binding protein